MEPARSRSRSGRPARWVTGTSTGSSQSWLPNGCASRPRRWKPAKIRGERWANGWSTASNERRPKRRKRRRPNPWTKSWSRPLRARCESTRRKATALSWAAARLQSSAPVRTCLRVFMHAPREWRVAHVMESTHERRDLAEGEIDRVDRARVAYVRQWYGLTFGDARNYDLCIDTSRLDAAQSAASIVAAVQARA